jgi:hypothetical protein
MTSSQSQLVTPILFLVFNRPDFTRQVFEEIRRARPTKLFVAADGPREGHPEDIDLCRQTQDLIRVDWDCDVQMDLRPKNRGAKYGVSRAIDWFFENVEEGIILEDDCLPDPSFFRFCQGLLAHYRNDTRVMHISGTNLQYGQKRGDGSYYFSRYMRCWGWASWRRAWTSFDVDLKTLPRFLEQRQLRNVLTSRAMRRYWRLTFEKVARGEITTVWDFQWTYAIFSQNGLCIIPNLNLVTNLGWGPWATNTFDPKNIMSNVKTQTIDSIVHPTFVLPDREADKFEEKHIFLLPFYKRVLNRIIWAGQVLKRIR